MIININNYMNRFSNIYINTETGKWVTLSNVYNNDMTSLIGEHESALIEWVYVHNRNTNKVIVVITDSEGNKIIPDKIEIVDLNTISISFDRVMAGKALMTFF